MMSTKKPNETNPWIEEHSSAEEAARSIVRRARLRGATIASSLPRLATDIDAFSADLQAIEDIFTKDPAAFRKVRALTAVHLPSIIASLDALISLRNSGAAPDKVELIEDDIRACLCAASQARAVLTSGAVTALEIEAATMRAAIAPDTLEDEAAQRAQPPASQGDRATSPLGRIAKSRSLKMGSLISGAYEQSRAQIAGASQAASDRVSASAGLAMRYAGDLLEDGVDYVTSPITRRMSAVGAALQTATTTALAGGVISALIFPPAIPVVLGVALLDGSSQYGRALESAGQTDAAEKQQRLEERDRERAALLSRIRGKSPLVRMETPHVHVTLNPETGVSQGLILTGKHTGADMSSLPIETLTLLGGTAPDPETREIILAFRNRLKAQEAKVARAAKSDKEPPSNSDAVMTLLELGIHALN